MAGRGLYKGGVTRQKLSPPLTLQKPVAISRISTAVSRLPALVRAVTVHCPVHVATRAREGSQSAELAVDVAELLATRPEPAAQTAN